ncbi:MAG: phage protease [Desulfobacterales bacterium]|nr:phage protease [Desulfobacterales bacterium]
MHKILHLISKIDKEESQAPEWMLLFKAGWGKLDTGEKFLVDEQAFDLVLKFITAQGNEVVFDYEHASLEKEAAPASGWIKELVWEKDVGIKARVEWTDTAKEYIANKEYRYFSPVFAVRKSDKRVCYLDSVALTNRPKTSNLTPILAKLEQSWERKIYKEEKMDREKLIADLGLKEDATDAEVLTAVAKLGVELPEAKTETKEVIPEKITAALDLKEDDDTSTIVASIHALKAGNDTGVSREEFNKLQAKLTKKDAEDAVDAAMTAGKVAPASKPWALAYAKEDLKGFNTFVAKAPVVVPVDDLPGKKNDDVPGDLTQTDLKVAKMFGVTEDDIKKYGGDQ